MDKYITPEKSICSFCSRLRHGVLYRIAIENNFNKIALGHHADDLIETLLLNQFFNGSIKARHLYYIQMTVKTRSSVRYAILKKKQ
jgi:tRNA 2-thiocytidine biosynthesis protein TtcA